MLKTHGSVARIVRLTNTPLELAAILPWIASITPLVVNKSVVLLGTVLLEHLVPLLARVPHVPPIRLRWMTPVIVRPTRCVATKPLVPAVSMAHLELLPARVPRVPPIRLL